MIRFKQFLIEKWFSTISSIDFGHRTDFDIFVNPTDSEIIKEITKDFRWCCFPKSQNMYVADANCIHTNIAKEAYKTEKSDCIYGTGYISKVNGITWDFIEEETLYPSDDGYYMDNYYMGPKMYEYDWNFMNKYIPNFSSYIRYQKDEVIRRYKEYQEQE